MSMTKRHRETHKLTLSTFLNVTRYMYHIYEWDFHIQQHYQHLKLKFKDIDIQLSGKLIFSESPTLAELSQYLVLTSAFTFLFFWEEEVQC